MIKEITIQTKKRNELVDITSHVKEFAKSIEEGTITIYCPHTTAGITINENADPTVKEDILRKLSELIPKNDNYKHMEGNSDSHIKATLTGSSATIIVQDGKPLLGTWQGILFCEYDGPRTRKIIIQTRKWKSHTS